MSNESPSTTAGKERAHGGGMPTSIASSNSILETVSIGYMQNNASTTPSESAGVGPKFKAEQAKPHKVPKKSAIGRITNIFRLGGRERELRGVATENPASAPSVTTAGDAERVFTSINQTSTASDMDVAADSPASQGQGTGSQPQGTLDIAAENEELTVGEMTLRVTVPAEQMEKEEKETLLKWLVASRGVLTAVQDIPGSVSGATGVGAVVGPIIAILKLIESDIVIDKRWNKARDTLRMHLEYVQREIGANAGTSVQANDSPPKRFVREYATELNAVLKTYLTDRGVNEDDIIEGNFTKILGYWRKASRALTSTVHIAKIDDLVARMTEALQNYERNKTTYIVDGTYQLLHANIDRLLRPFRSDAQQPEGNGRHHTKCHAETRMGILSDIREWMSSVNGPSFHLLIDAAGLGKSTVAYTLAQERWDTKTYLGASFFFSRGNTGTSTPLDFMRHIAWSLMQSYPQIKHHESMSYENINKGLDSHSLADQWDQLVSTPLAILLNEAKITNRQIILIIDALDECSEDQRDDFLRLLAKLPGDRIKVLMTSRPGHDVESLLGGPGKLKQDSLEDRGFNAADLQIYVADRFNDMRMSKDEATKLSTYSGGLFILAATVCDLLQKSVARKRLLKEIVEDDNKPVNQRLERLYMGILKPQLDGDRCSKNAIQDVFRIIFTAKRSLTGGEIKALLSSTDELDVSAIIRRFSSVLQGGNSDEAQVYVRHPTFREFMLDQKSSGEYGVSLESAHRLIALSCLSLMASSLHPNMCHIDARVSFSETQSALDLARQLQDHVDPAVLYAASNWTFHVTECRDYGSMAAQVQDLFVTKLLNWIELGAIGGYLPQFMRGIHRLQLVIGNRANNFCEEQVGNHSEWCRDTLEFLRHNQTLLSHCPLQVYSSALTFAPRQSRIYLAYADVALPRTLIGHLIGSPDTLVLGDHRYGAQVVAYSADGELLAVAEGGRGLAGLAPGGAGILVWDARTGARQWDFKPKGRPGYFSKIAFLPEGQTMLSIWKDSQSQHSRLYQLNCEAKALVCPPEDLNLPTNLTCMSWTLDANWFAYGTEDGRVHLFRLGADIPSSSIGAHEDLVSNIYFSCDGRAMASTSRHGTIKIWSVTSEGLVGPTNILSTTVVYGGAFSPVNSSLFTFLDGSSMYIYDLSTDTIDRRITCEGATQMVYSHDGKYIATQGPSSTVLIINIDQNKKTTTREMFTGHSGYIHCLALSPDNSHLATGGDDNLARIHKLSSTSRPTQVTGHQARVVSLNFSLDGEWLASADYKGNLHIWDIKTGSIIQGPIHIGMRWPYVAISSDKSIVAWVSTYDSIRFWSTKSRKLIGAALRPEMNDIIFSMVFSPDDTKLALTTSDRQIVLLDLQSAHSSSIQPATTIDLIFFPGKRLLAFHPSGEYICCGGHAWKLSNNSPNRITGESLSTILEETFPLTRFDWKSLPPPSISFGSPTRQVLYVPSDLYVYGHTMQDGRIALGAGSGHVMVLDFTHLATKEERALLGRIKSMRRDAVVRSESGWLRKVLSSYSGPSERFILLEQRNSD